MRQRGQRDTQRDKGLEVIRLAALHGQEHIATRVFVHLRISRREFNEQLALGREQRKEAMRELGEKQVRVLKTLRQHGKGWYQGGPFVFAGISARPVLDSLVKRGLVVMMPRFVPNRGTQDVYSLTDMGAQLVDEMEKAKCAS